MADLMSLSEIDIRAYNRAAWDRQVAQGNRWTLPVSEAEVAAAREGQWQIVLTPLKPVPRAWFPELKGCEVLCLASGGGQQGPILAAVGARVTVLDNSPGQLRQDRLVAEREGFSLITVEGDMTDLHMFRDACFDLVVHPVSNLFVPDVRSVWSEVFRVLRPGGVLLAGFNNPARYLFDLELEEQAGILQVKYALPYADVLHLSEAQKRQYLEDGWPFEFSHTLEDQIGGQLAAGFLLTGFYEDRDPESEGGALSRYMDIYIATGAVKPPEGGV